jgi:hypothetical protein
MLVLNNVTVNLQNFGTILGIFLVGKSKESIEERYFSFWNHGATGGDLEWWCDTCALFWIYTSKNQTAEDKLLTALANGALAELINKGSKGHDPWPEACEIAMDRYEQMDHVTWFKTEKVWEMYDVGDSVTAEKGTGNFDDDVLGKAVTRTGTASLDMIKATISADETEAEDYNGTPEEFKKKPYGRHYTDEKGDGQDVQLAGVNASGDKGHAEEVSVKSDT